MISHALQKDRAPMEDVDELIVKLGLEKDLEHVIIPFKGKDGKNKRCFLLKRRFIRIVYPDGYYLDIPLTAAIESTIQHPELLLSEAIMLTHKDLIERKTKIVEEGSEAEEQTKGDSENGQS